MARRNKTQLKIDELLIDLKKQRIQAKADQEKAQNQVYSLTNEIARLEFLLKDEEVKEEAK